MNDEDCCETCWHYYGAYPSCHHPAVRANTHRPCGWYQEKDKPKEIDEWELHQREWE